MNAIDHTKLVVSTLLTTLILLSGIANAQTIYEWRSDDGERSYSDTPPENVEVQSTGIEISATDTAAVKAQDLAKRETAAEQAEINRLNSAKAASDAEIAAKKKEQSDANCAKARNKLTLYKNNRRVYREGPDGEVTEWLDIDQERAKAQKEVDTYCK